MKVVYSLIVAFILSAGQLYAQTDTLRIATYNLLKFGTTATSRSQHFITVIDALDPDVLVVQELSSGAGFNTFASEVIKQLNNEYNAAPFSDGPDTDNGLFYKPDRVGFRATNQIATDLRDISEYILEISGIEFRVYALHLKAGSSTSDRQRRLSECTTLRDYMNALPSEKNLIVAGDFNMRSSSEAAFTMLTSDQTDNDGRLLDPIERPGSWHDNTTFAPIHTQSTRTTRFGGGASGGLDDRFDMMLVSPELLAEGGLDILPGTYRTFGNDGGHFNSSVNFGSNGSVQAAVAEALHQASDHLPVSAEFTVIVLPTSAEPSQQAPATFALHQNYPNPFNPKTTIQYSVAQQGHVTLKIFNLLGALVEVLIDGVQRSGEYRVEFDGRSHPSGVYMYQLAVSGVTVTKKLILLK